MVKTVREAFSLRAFLGFCTGIGLLCSFGAYAMALAAFVAAVLHLVLLMACARFARGYPHDSNPILRKRFARETPSDNGPATFVICYIVVFYCWHVLPLFFNAQDIRSIWNPASLFGVSLYTMEHCAVAMVHIFVYVSLFGAAYGNGYVCPRNCAITACSSVMLLATHFAIPYA